MIISSLIGFIIAVGAAYSIPGWHVGMHFFPYTFLMAYMMVYGVDHMSIPGGLLYAIAFEFFLGLSLGSVSLAFLAAAALLIIAGRVVTLKPLIANQTWFEWLSSLGVGSILWVVMLAGSWAVEHLAYRDTLHPLSVVARVVSDQGSILTMLVEYGLFVLFMLVVYRQTNTHATFS